MAFPQTPLEVRVDLMIDGAWSNVTSDVLVRDGVNISRGRADEASQADPSTCTLTLENRDGRYSPRNPRGALYGKIGRNTPMRVGVGTPSVAAGAQTSVDSTSLVAPSVTAEVASTLYCVWAASPVGNITGPGGFTMGSERDGSLSTWAAGAVGVSAGATGASTATHSVTATDQAAISVVVPGSAMVSGGFSLSSTNRSPVTFDVTGVLAGDYLLAVQGWSSDTENRMTVLPAIDGIDDPGWMELADTGVSTGPRLRAWICRMPTGAAATQSIHFAGWDPPSTLPIVNGGDNYARVWRIRGATDFYPRHVGEVSSWPQRWDLSGVDVHSPVTSSGVLRRLGQGSAPLRSALNRHIVQSADVVAYWPCEDEADSTSIASAIHGVEPATFRGTPVFAADDGFLGSDPLPTWQAAGFVGEVPAYTATGELFMGAMYSIPTSGMVGSGANLLSVGFTGGTISRAILEYYPTGDLSLKLYDRTTNTPIIDTSPGFDFSFDGDQFFAWVTLWQSGADVNFQVNAMGVVDGDYSPRIGQSLALTAGGQTLGKARAVSAGIEGFNALNGALSLTVPVTIGHITIGTKRNAVFRSDALHYYPALVGHYSEGASERIVRLCREEGISVLGYYDEPSSVGPYFVNSTPLGAQRSGTLLDLLREAEEADDGLLYEPRGFIGLAYRPRSSRENRDPDFTLSYTAGHIAEPFEPVDDDQATRNDVTVTRIGGSSARAELTTGALSVLAPPNGVGRYDDAVELSLWKDSQAAEQANWRLHLGTWDEARYPSVTVNLAAEPTLITSIASAECGDVGEITDLPTWLPPGPVAIGVEGYSETLEPYGWSVTFNASPASPYRVVELDSADYGRLDSDDSTLSSAISTTGNTLLVAVASGSPLWITTATHPTEFPFAATMGGETITVTSITGTSSPQSWFVTRSVNGVVKSHAIGTKISLAEPAYVPLGGEI